MTRHLIEGGEQSRGRHDEFSSTQVQPSAHGTNRCGALSGGQPNLVLDDEAKAVGTHRHRCMGHEHCFVQADLAKVLELVLADYWANAEAAEFTGWKSVIGEEGHPDVCGEIQVGRVRHVAVEVHGAPACDELFEIS